MRRRELYMVVRMMDKFFPQKTISRVLLLSCTARACVVVHQPHGGGNVGKINKQVYIKFQFIINVFLLH